MEITAFRILGGTNMRSHRITALGGAAVLLLLVSACGDGNPSTQTSSSGGGGASAGTAGASLGAADVKVSATDALAFDPKTSTAKVGQIVQWANTGTVPHNITFSGNASGLDDTAFSPGSTWQVKFTAAGTYQYQCTIHPGMTATITVS